MPHGRPHGLVSAVAMATIDPKRVALGAAAIARLTETRRRARWSNAGDDQSHLRAHRSGDSTWRRAVGQWPTASGGGR